MQERHREGHTLTPTDTRHQGGMARVHPPPRSQSKQLPRVITVDICPNNDKNKITRNVLKYNFLFFTMTSRCWNRTPKAILPAEEKKSKAALLAFCGSGQQEEIFYSMAATIVRLEGNSYRLSRRKVKLSCHCLCLQERYDPFFLITTSIFSSFTLLP